MSRRGNLKNRSSSVSIEISRETEACLADEARRQGISVDALLERLVSERGATGPGRRQRLNPQVADSASRSDGSTPSAGHLRRRPLSRGYSMRTFWPMPRTQAPRTAASRALLEAASDPSIIPCPITPRQNPNSIATSMKPARTRWVSSLSFLSL